MREENGLLHTNNTRIITTLIFAQDLGVLSHDVVALFVEVLDLIPVFRIDDVYVGLLAKETGIIATHSTGFEPSVSSPNELCIPLPSTLVRHGTLGECLEDIFNRSITKTEKV